MKLCEVKQIKESYSDAEVNKFLKQGYELLKIISSRNSKIDIDEIRPCYILGLKKN